MHFCPRVCVWLWWLLGLVALSFGVALRWLLRVALKAVNFGLALRWLLRVALKAVGS